MRVEGSTVRGIIREMDVVRSVLSVKNQGRPQRLVRSERISQFFLVFFFLWSSCQ